MKSFLVLLFVILSVFAAAHGADECKVGGHTFGVGETYSVPGKCELVTCTGPNDFSGKTCPLVETLKPCEEIPQDNSKPYPECCPQFKC